MSEGTEKKMNRLSGDGEELFAIYFIVCVALTTRLPPVRFERETVYS